MRIELPIGTRFFDEYGNCFEAVKGKGEYDCTECDVCGYDTFLCCAGERDDKTEIFFKRVNNG